MKDFNSFSGEEKKQSASDDAVDMAKMMAKAFGGKGEADILRAIYKAVSYTHLTLPTT